MKLNKVFGFWLVLASYGALEAASSLGVVNYVYKGDGIAPAVAKTAHYVSTEVNSGFYNKARSLFDLDPSLEIELSKRNDDGTIIQILNDDNRAGFTGTVDIDVFNKSLYTGGLFTDPAGASLDLGDLPPLFDEEEDLDDLEGGSSGAGSGSSSVGGAGVGAGSSVDELSLTFRAIEDNPASPNIAKLDNIAVFGVKRSCSDVLAMPVSAKIDLARSFGAYEVSSAGAGVVAKASYRSPEHERYVKAYDKVKSLFGGGAKESDSNNVALVEQVLLESKQLSYADLLKKKWKTKKRKFDLII